MPAEYDPLVHGKWLFAVHDPQYYSEIVLYCISRTKTLKGDLRMLSNITKKYLVV